MILVVGKRGMVDFRHFRMIGEEFNYLQRIFHMALYAKGESLNSLQEDECVEG